jgi:hypothetical protein
LREKNINKKILYALASKAVKARIEQVQKKYLQEREAIYLKYQRGVWADWLKLKATEGNAEALNALRSREMRQPLQGNLFTGQGLSKATLKSEVVPDNITKTGTIIYRVGTSAIRDDGELIKISRGSSEQGIVAALHMAIDRYGACITVNGSEPFKNQVAQVAAKLKLNLTFDNPKLELQRQNLIKINSIMKENNHEQRQPDFKRRGTTRSSDEGFRSPHIITSSAGRGNRDVGYTSKPHIGRIGQQPPPESKNRLRSLSQLGVVQFTSRGEVLLQSDVSRHVEHQGPQSDNGLRRNVSGAGAVKLIADAADKYIAERELMRQKVADISLHRRHCPQDEGMVLFAGLRKVDFEMLALLKHGEHIIVLPIDAATARRVKQLSIGTPLKLTSKGIALSRVRRR